MTAAPEPQRPSGAGQGPKGPPVHGVVVGVDLRGIQAYVYSGRRILDAVGRAAQVAELTDASDPEHGIADLVPPDCLVLRDAGGAFTAVFADKVSAREFTARYTRRLRDRAGGLTPVVAHVPYGSAHAGNPEETGDRAVPTGVDEALSALPARLRRARRRMSALHTPAHGYGITAVCSVTGGPAESVDSSRTQDGHADVHERVAADVVRARGIGRRWHRSHSSSWLAGALTATGSLPLALPTEVDRLGREHGGVSRVAVVHIDVNGLGVILGDYRERAGDPGTPGSGALAQRYLSTRIAGLTEGLARALVRAVAATVRAEPGRRTAVLGAGDTAPLFLHHVPPGPVYLPLRPIVVAGDDLTVLCDARLALSLVRYAFDWLDVDPTAVGDPRDPRVGLHRALAEAHGDRPGGGRLVVGEGGEGGGGHTTFVPTVGVGVAVQPVGAPLSSGYDLCEAMCRRAKEERVRRAEADPAAPDDHTVAWTTRFDGVDRVLHRLEQDRGAPLPRTELPLTGAGFTRFLDRYLSETAPGGLLSGGGGRHRNWLVSSLLPLVEAGVDPGAELARRARVTGHPVELPQGWTPGGLADAVEVMDLYLDPGWGKASERHRSRPQGRTGTGGPQARAAHRDVFR